MRSLRDTSSDHQGQPHQENSASPRASITGVTSSNPTTGGVDWLGVSVWLGWSVAAHERFIDCIETALRKAEESGEVEVIEGLPCDDLVAVVPFGGKARGMKYQLQFQGMKVDFSSSRVPGESHPNCSVNIPSTVLMVAGHRGAWSIVEGFLSALGCEVMRTNVKRLDVCVDLAGVDISQFIDLIHADAYVCRAQKEVQYKSHKRVTGYEMGKNVRCRIYDKAFEVIENEDKQQIMREKRWGQDEVLATRVEFQLRSEVLRERDFGGTVVQVFDKLPLICDWLTSKWLRLTETVVDRSSKNQSKAQVAEIWQLVQDYFQEWAGKNVEAFVTPLKRCGASGKALKAQTIGCLATLFVKQKSSDGDVKEFLLELVEEFIPEIERKEPDRRKRESLGFGLVPAGDMDGVPF